MFNNINYQHHNLFGITVGYMSIYDIEHTCSYHWQFNRDGSVTSMFSVYKFI